MTDPNADVIKGYEFCATLQLRTPLRVLQHHGEVQQWSENGLPTYAHFLWEGIWLPITYSWEELSARHGNSAVAKKAELVLPNAMASDIGPIPQDGGTYLGFLRAFRGIVEFSASPDEKREAIETLSRDHPDYAKYISIHRARSSNWPDEWLGYEEWLQVPGIGTRIARRLYDAGFRSREALHQASDADLAAIKGVGKATIFRIKHVTL
jgi:hypothetical protein